MKVVQLCPTLCNPMESPWNSLGQNTEVGSLFLLQGIFPTQGWNPGLPHCRWILYQLSHNGSQQRKRNSLQKIFMSISQITKIEIKIVSCIKKKDRLLRLSCKFISDFLKVSMEKKNSISDCSLGFCPQKCPLLTNEVLLPF